MYILNKETNEIQECSHNDVIRSCRKDTDHFTVAETKEELMPSNGDGGDTLNDTSGETGGGEDPESGETADGDEKYSLEELEAMELAELKALAKEKNIKGYAKMEKEAIVQVITAIQGE